MTQFSIFILTLPEAPHEHTSSDWITTLEPTCTEKGSKHKVCTECEEELETEEIPALGHDWGEWEVTTAPNCTEKGQETRVCKNDPKHTEIRDTAALGHDIVHHDAQAATCTEAGWKAYDTCTRCDYTTYEEIPATGHTLSDWVTTEEPGCTEKGSKERECSVCHVKENEEIPALGHDYGEWTLTKAATCTAKGEEQRSCSRCDATETRNVDMLDHTPSDWTVTKEPTETEKGSKHKVCTVCGTELEAEEIEKLTPTVPEEVTAFKSKVAVIANTTGRAAKFAAIKEAIIAYNELDASEKESVAEEYAALSAQASAYNEVAEAVNEEVASATKNAFSIFNALSALFAALWTALKDLF